MEFGPGLPRLVSGRTRSGRPGRRHPERNRTRRMRQGPVLRRTLRSSQNGYGGSYIIAFPRGERNYSPLVNMLSRRWKGFMERRRFVPAMGKAWIKARKHDRFYRAAKKQAYRSRAAIKLSQIDLRYGVFHDGDLVVDLGAAPGGWSQIARERIGAKGDRKSTRLNSSHLVISYAVFCLKKKKESPRRMPPSAATYLRTSQPS